MTFAVNNYQLVVGVGSLSAAAAALLLSWKYVAHRRVGQKLEALRSQKRKERDASFEILTSLPLFDKRVLTNELVESLTSLSVKQVHEKYADGSLSVRVLISAYCVAATSAHAKTNCCTLAFFEQALACAQEYDEILAPLQKCTNLDERLMKWTEMLRVKPLWGIPVSVKEQYATAGKDTLNACIAQSGNAQAEDGLLVAAIRAAGGIILVSTQQPQLLMEFESENFIWGECTHPSHSEYSPGGSTGGEGALLALHGSLVGLGSCMCGSTRQPAHSCGIVGFRGSPFRTTLAGLHGNGAFQHLVRPTAGPMARCTADLVPVLQAWWSAFVYEKDSSVPPVAFDVGRYSRLLSYRPALRFGYIETDGFFPPSPACRRVLKETIAALERNGHCCVPFELPCDAWTYYMHMLHLLECEAVPFYAAYLGQEEALPALKKHLFANIPACLRIAKGYLLSALGEKRRAQMECFNRVPLNSLRGWFEMTKQQTMMKIDVAAAMASQAIDVIITPADALPAYRRGFSSHVLLPTSYCQLFNWLHMCAGSVPMGRVMENETSMGDDGFNDSLTGAFNWSLEYASGLPVSVQVGALPYRDELCLYAMTALESVSNFTDHEKLSPH